MFENEPKNNYCPTQWTRVNLNSNRADPCAGLCDVRPVPTRPYPMQAIGLNFDGAARLFTVPGLSQTYFTYPTWLVQCANLHYINPYFCLIEKVQLKNKKFL